ncbi:DUF4232 domain-containing protein [Streptomyces sp. NPDC004728]|uniref:DUF4232 domain-containing protein n=1 Tax=Streptomyces sp. NPDC004728 TaxID=3154289 RepID=UPI0033ACE394
MASILGLLKVRESAARERVEDLRDAAARAAAALEAAEIELDRRVIAREELVEALAASAAGITALTEAETEAESVPASAPLPGTTVEASNTKSGSGEDTEAEAAANGATTTSGKITFCKTADLAIDATDAAPDEDSGRIDITMINRGSTTCSATGFAGVDIKDADNTSNPIERGVGSYG